MLTSLFHAMWYASLAAELALLGKVFAAGLARRYPAFTLWLVIDLSFTGTLLAFENKRQVYQVAYAAGSVLEVAAQIWFILEVFRAHHRHYRGMRTIGTTLLLIFAGLAVLGAVIFSPAESIAFQKWETLAPGIARAVGSAASLFLMIVAVVFAFISVPTKRNVLALERLSAIYFGLVSAFLFALNVSAGKNALVLNIAIQTVSLAIFLAAAFTLSRDGERLPPSAGIHETAEVVRTSEEMMGFLKSFRWSRSKGLHGKH